MSGLEIVGAATLAVLGVAAAWLVVELGRYYARGWRNVLMVYAVHREQGDKVFWWRFPKAAWDLAGADSVKLISSGRTVFFNARKDPTP